MKMTLLLALLFTMAACSRNGKSESVATAADTTTSAPDTGGGAPQQLKNQSQTPSRPTVVDALTIQGFKFVLVATKDNTDLVLVDHDANNQAFEVGDVACSTHILAKEDPTYPGEELGVIQVVCESHGVKLISSASCSPRYPEVQSHFEVGEGPGSYNLDLVCRYTPR